MDAHAYALEAEIEADHWWFEGRRQLFSRIIRQLQAEPSWKILDVGTSTGTNLRMLRDMEFQDVTGLDNSESAIQFCASKGFGPVHLGDVQEMPFENESFDLILATDIVEHVPDDSKAVKELARILAPGGKLLVTVPAFMSLWGRNDETAHHQRRYTMSGVLDIVRASGLSVEQNYYFNFLLFLPIWLVRVLMKRFGADGGPPENEINSPRINRLLKLLFSIDVRIAAVIHPPFGVSALVVATKPFVKN